MISAGFFFSSRRRHTRLRRDWSSDVCSSDLTIATAIRIGNPQSWDQALKLSKESNGWFDAFADKEILAAQKMLTEKEGVFCEPASATSVAGAMRDIKLGKIPEGSSVVCTLTGHGLKDPDSAIAQCDQSAMINVNPTLEEVKKAILDQM